MTFRAIFSTISFVCLLIPSIASARPPVFPGAKGWGTRGVAGSGRHLDPPSTTYTKVTSLNCSGAGTLQACIEASGPRTCIFETSGVINCNSATADNARFIASDPYLTVAGHTAPSPGISIHGAQIRIDVPEVTIQHVRMRVGDASHSLPANDRDCFSINGTDASTGGDTRNIVFDHVSCAWAVDEAFHIFFRTNEDITVSNSIIGDSLYDSISAGDYAFGPLIDYGNGRIFIWRNLFGHQNDRNPNVKSGNNVAFVNNVVYNYASRENAGPWNVFAFDDDSSSTPYKISHIGNHFKAGPTTDADLHSLYDSGVTVPVGSLFYVSQNIDAKRPTNNGDDYNSTNFSATYKATEPPEPLPEGVEPIHPELVDDFVAAGDLGAWPSARDAVDQAMIDDYEDGTGEIINCVESGAAPCDKNAGGWPTVTVNTHTLTVPTNPDEVQPSGYTRGEEWLHGYYSAAGDAISDAPKRANIKRGAF